MMFHGGVLTPAIALYYRARSRTVGRLLCWLVGHKPNPEATWVPFCIRCRLDGRRILGGTP